MTADERIAWMRRLGVIHATWDGDTLTAATLGPDSLRPSSTRR